MLLEGERIDDLQVKDYKIIQNTNGFCFGIDAVLLANFVKYKKNDVIADFGTGTGIIPILISAKSDIKKIYAIEIQKQIADMAKRSIKLNNLEDKIEVLNINLTQSLQYIEKNSVDIVTSNPPYMPKDKLLSTNEMMKISRNEIYCTLSDIMKISSDLLKPNGKMYMVHRPSRLCDIFVEARKNKLEPKTLQLIHPKINKPANLALIQFTKNSKPELKMLDDIYVHNDDGSYTSSINTIYSKEFLDIDENI